MDPTLHPDVAMLACLLGRWVGEGGGVYPTVEPFRYREDVSFSHVGKPFLAYRQVTVNLGTGLPSHAEVGFFRTGGTSRVELVIAHPTGVAEIEEGSLETSADGLVLQVRSTSVAGTTTSKEVLSLERRIEVVGDLLSYDLSMGAVGQPHQHHLAAQLHRVGPDS